MKQVVINNKNMQQMMINDKQVGLLICYVNENLIDNGDVKVTSSAFQVINSKNVTVKYGGKAADNIETLILDEIE